MKNLLLIIPIILTGCQAIPINSGAEKVRITRTEPSKECVFLGDITGSQGNSWTGPFTLNSNLETGARNDLKNKAYALNGNTVYIITHSNGAGGEFEQNSTIYSGTVFKCPN